MSESYSLDKVQNLYPEYNISEFIDSGGTKQVFMGELDGEQVVVKILPVESRHRLRRAEREARAMEIIDSEIFVSLKEHFIDELPEENKTIFVIVEEYIDGRTLEETIDEGDFGPALGVRVLDSLLTVLQSFEKEDIIHRDIKPSNIMISSAGEIRLLDVGIARFTKKKSLTDTGADYAPGTHGYRAPEQIKNKKDEQDIRTDLFAAGIVFFEAVTGEHPFDHGREDISDEILNNNRKSFPDVEGNEDLSRIFETLTAPEPYQRYRKPEHAKQELNFIQGDSYV